MVFPEWEEVERLEREKGLGVAIATDGAFKYMSLYEAIETKRKWGPEPK